MVNIHYCMGKVAEVNYGHDEQTKCGKCGMDQKNGCCQTEHKLLKADGDQLFVQTSNINYSLPAVISDSYSGFNVSSYPGRDHYFSQYHSPPDVRGTDLGVYISVFRI